MPTATEKQLDRLCQPVPFHGRPRRGLNPLRAEEQQLFLAVLRGDHLLNGFRNRDLVEWLYPRSTKDSCEQRRRTARVSRLIQLLRAHRLVAQVPHSYRYHVTDKGQALMGAAVDIRHKAFPKELNDVV